MTRRKEAGSQPPSTEPQSASTISTDGQTQSIRPRNLNEVIILIENGQEVYTRTPLPTQYPEDLHEVWAANGLVPEERPLNGFTSDAPPPARPARLNPPPLEY